jgi:hypothetical protein
MQQSERECIAKQSQFSIARKVFAGCETFSHIYLARNFPDTAALSQSSRRSLGPHSHNCDNKRQQNGAIPILTAGKDAKSAQRTMISTRKLCT